MAGRAGMRPTDSRRRGWSTISRPSSTGSACERSTFSAGDHDLFIGRVDTLANETHHPMPLLYYRRRYLRVERAATSDVEGKPEA